jgi:hypothetical protein
MLRIWGVERECAKGLHQCHRLLQVPAARRTVVVILARHGRVQPEERIVGLDRKVRAAGDAGPLRQEAAPGVSAL